MNIFKHELKLSKLSLIIWTSSISFFMICCVILYPSMKEQMQDISDSFASMGQFSQAFGLDKISFGTLMGYYSVECGNVLGLGGAFFAALIGVNALAKEEKEHTVEFLITHPVKRSRIVFEKALVVLFQVIIMNIIITLLSLLSFVLIGETPTWDEFFLLHFSYLLMQIEIAAICFGISSFSNKGTMGIGLGLATIFYFLNIMSNLLNDLKWIKFLTPFGYCDGADILANGKIDISYVLVGYAVAILSVGFAFYYYNKKDIKG